MLEIQEGSARILMKKKWLERLSSDSPVFYNPAMRINRDITVLILQASKEILGRRLSVLDSMAASGIRGIRFLKETDAINELVLCDINEKAIEFINKNLEINNVSAEVVNNDCRIIMLERKFDFIDIDPFGSPIGFVEPAILSLKNKGILAITATDISALSGSKKEACLRKYFCIGKKMDFYLEFGIRNLARYIIETGIRHEIAMIPVFAYYDKHHYRIFFQKSRRKKELKELINNIKHIVYCTKCLYKDVLIENVNATCDCGSKPKILGPIYIGGLYKNEFTEKIYDLSRKLETICDYTKKKLDVIYNNDYALKEVWYYFNVHWLAKKQKIEKIPKIEKILEKFNAKRTHFSPTGIKCKCNRVIIHLVN